MRYTVNGRAQSIITAALAVLLALAMVFSASARVDPAHRGAGDQVASPRFG